MPRACGKIILLGEHAVVHGRPALAASIEPWVEITAHRSDLAESRLDIPDWDLHVSSSDSHAVARAMALITNKLSLPDASIRFTGQATLAAGSGLGSSAALCVALARATAELLDRDVPDRDIEGAANAGESVFHNNPSGIDVAVAARGGYIYFEKGAARTLPIASTTLCAIAISPEKPSTKVLVERVQERLSTHPEETQKIFDVMGELARKGVEFVRNDQNEKLGVLMQTAHLNLVDLGVSTDSLNTLVSLAMEKGAFGAKLSGAGGGGAVIALAPADCIQNIVDVWKASGVESFVSKIGAST